MYFIGQELFSEKASYRVCAISKCSNFHALTDMSINYQGNFKKPFVLNGADLADFIKKNRLSIGSYALPAEFSFSDNKLRLMKKDKWLEIRDAKWNAVKQLLSSELVENYLFGSGIYHEIKNAQNYGKWKSSGAYYKAINQYIIMGAMKNAFLPVGFNNCGTSYKCPEKLNTALTKRGRKSKLNTAAYSPITVEIKKKIKEVINGLKGGGKKFSLRQSYKMYQDYYETHRIEREMPTGNTHVYLAPFKKEETISYDQFRYHFFKLTDSESILKIKHGNLKYEKDIAPRTGSARDGVLGATHRYEVDATVLDVYVAYPFDKNLSVGRPVLYLVTDVHSSMIVGMYVGFSGPDADGVFLALSNACLDKVEYAKRFGLHINHDDWPVCHIPKQITIDNGREYKDLVISNALKSMLGIEAVNIAAVYRGDAKGTVERKFGVLNDSVIHHQPGSIFKNIDRTETHPSNNAAITYDELVRILISEIIYQNNSANRLKKLGFKGAVERSGFTPQAIFLHSLQNEMHGGNETTKADTAKVCWAFLPEENATVTDYGIIFRGLEYVSEHPLIRSFFSIARKKRFKIQIKRLKDYCDHLWYFSNAGEFIRLDLKNINNSSPYSNQHWEIIDHRLVDESILDEESTENERLQRVIRNNRIENSLENISESNIKANGRISKRKVAQKGIKCRKQEQHYNNRVVEGENLTDVFEPVLSKTNKTLPVADEYDLDTEFFG